MSFPLFYMCPFTSIAYCIAFPSGLGGRLDTGLYGLDLLLLNPFAFPYV